MSYSALEFFKIDQKQNPLAHWSLEDFESELDSEFSHSLCLTHEGRLGGFLFFRVFQGHATIMNMSVYPRGQGLGSALMTLFLERLLRDFKDVKSILLEVRVSNVAALKLYEKFDFLELSQRENYYQGRETALVLEKHLKTS